MVVVEGTTSLTRKKKEEKRELKKEEKCRRERIVKKERARESDFRSICISVGKPCQIEDPRSAKENIVYVTSITTSTCRDYVN